MAKISAAGKLLQEVDAMSEELQDAVATYDQAKQRVAEEADEAKHLQSARRRITSL